MNDEIIKLLTERYYNKEPVSDWAIKCLEKGYDSKSLRMLAAMPESLYSSSETDSYLKRALEELSWDEIRSEDFLLDYAKILAKEIVENRTDPIRASCDIYALFIDLEYPSKLRAWFDLSEMIWDYEYFLKTGENNSYWFRTKEELIAEIKKASNEFLKTE